MNSISEKNLKSIQTIKYGRITVVWQGAGTYYLVDKLGLWFHIHCDTVAEYVFNPENNVKTIEL